MGTVQEIVFPWCRAQVVEVVGVIQRTLWQAWVVRMKKQVKHVKLNITLHFSWINMLTLPRKSEVFYDKAIDSAAASVNSAPDITKEIAKRSEIKYQSCEGLKLELNRITTEVETAMEMIGILKEELGIADTEVRDNTSIAQNNENGSYIPPSERNWIQIQTNRHKKVIDKLKDHRA
jgi:hypothetical protein